MERLTISMSDEFAAELSAYMRRHGYDNRSEAVRDLARNGLAHAMLGDGAAGECVAVLSYVYDHHSRELPRRLTETHHAHHDLQVATLHVHLDHENCLEVTVLRGDFAAVQDLANSVRTERGVNHAVLSPVPVAVEHGVHAHGPVGGPGPHDHQHPKL
jgi:CopG family transcriptional regulator, nickel-responsive regulator